MYVSECVCVWVCVCVYVFCVCELQLLALSANHISQIHRRIILFADADDILEQRVEKNYSDIQHSR